MPLLAELDVRAVLPTVRVPTLVGQHADNALILPEWGKYVADHFSGAKYVELPGRNMYHLVEPWRSSFQEIAEFLTGHQAEVADDRVLATVLFTDIVDSTRRASETATVTGMRCSMRTTLSSGRSCLGFDAVAPVWRIVTTSTSAVDLADVRHIGVSPLCNGEVSTTAPCKSPG